MISHKYKCVFVHIPKSAGTSIGTKLELYGEEFHGMQDHRPINLLSPVDAQFLTQLYKKDHAYAFYRKIRDRVLENRPFLTKEQYETYFKFTFVRNPWARVHSWYKNVKRDPVHRKTYDVAEDSTLNWFVKNRLYTVDSQLDFIYDLNGEIALDFIGRFEHLQEDFSFVCDVLGIDNSSLPEKLRSSNSSYLSAYDQESVDIVAEAFQDEIELFGFEFTGLIVDNASEAVKPYLQQNAKGYATAEENALNPLTGLSN